jgi:hypothetical protein
MAILDVPRSDPQTLDGTEVIVVKVVRLDWYNDHYERAALWISIPLAAS